jgi:hypothetical protein
LPSHNIPRYVFDDLSSDQAEGLLTYHGGPASYLVINSNSYPEWLFYVKLKDDEGIMFHSHTVTKMNGGYIMQGKTVVHNSLDDVEQAFLATYKARGTVLSPLFHDDRPEIADKDGDPERIKNLTISQCFDLPPEYQSANRYPKAPSKALPSVKPFKAIMPSPLPQSPNPPPNPPPPEPKSSCCCTVL